MLVAIRIAANAGTGDQRVGISRVHRRWFECAACKRTVSRTTAAIRPFDGRSRRFSFDVGPALTPVRRRLRARVRSTVAAPMPGHRRSRIAYSDFSITYPHRS
ncbi:hypothetical protein EA472_00165 [Natrarchaeobius oligotrophus]|uniref:Transposase n=1 Tax=Natrarchaeobius chitinivorans TaxID=1679083 RepID=A0A3N6MG70_NATCH|nr:hypothetical protein EA472_00165 [Natrarchaeobius chitinivorans]